MKPLFVLVAVGLVAVCSSAGYAQQMMIGVRGGVNLANQEFSQQNGDKASIKTRFLAGGEIDYWFSDTWALSFQVLYDEKGANGQMSPPFFNGIAIEQPTSWISDYIEVPLLAKLQFGDGALKPFLFAGPSIGLLISNMEDFDYGSGYSYDLTDSTNRIDLSIVAGAGISFALPSKIQLLLDAGYAYGLTNSDNYYFDRTNGFHVYSRDIRLAAGILFPIK